MILLLALMPVAALTAASDTLNLLAGTSSITLFPQGAQVTRQTTYTLSPGQHQLVISGLAEGIDPSTIQVKMNQGVTILAVNFRQKFKHTNSYLSEKQFNDSISYLNWKKRELADQIWVIGKELVLLEKNQKHGGDKRNLTPAEMKASVDFYRNRLTELLLKRTKQLAAMRKADDRLTALLDSMAEAPDTDPTRINQAEVLVDCPKACSGSLVISYFTEQAGWKPVYELRLNESGTQLQLTRGAMAFNKTTETWEKVGMKFVTTNPRLSGIKPELRPQFIGLEDDTRPGQAFSSTKSSTPPYWWSSYNGEKATLKGTVVDKETKEPIPFANVTMEADGYTTGGATTDIDGNYTINNVVPGTYSLNTSFVGYERLTKEQEIRQAGIIEFCNLQLKASATILEAVEVFDYKIPLIAKDETTTGATITMESASAGYREESATSPVNSRDGRQGSVRGSRNNASVEYIDGIQVVTEMSDLVIEEDTEHVQNHATSETIDKMPKRDAHAVAAAVGGVASGSNSPSITSERSGSREIIGQRFIPESTHRPPPPTKQYEIDDELTLPSDGAFYRFELGEETLAVSTTFQTVPLLDNRAFIEAAIPRWEELLLASGEASLYVGNTYVGKSAIDATQLTDTAFVALGAASWIASQRSVVNELSTDELVGGNRRVSRTIEIEIRNNSRQQAPVMLEDRMPVSLNREIKIELTDRGKAVFDETTGHLKWNFALDGGETQKIRFTYSVRFPASYGRWIE